ncbi:MAG: hypothetical protein CSB55_02055 [Candidatus Cloacimonadota bacterium]|nr:MAG: hypothetical protein CSB55_02055 [Candidatus Cloacimonadota bacterium]
MIVARVNNIEITAKEYDFELQLTKTKNCLDEASPECCKRVMDCLIDAALLRREAVSHGIKISEDEVEEHVIDFMLNHEDEKEFNETMQKFHVTQDYIRNRLKSKLLIKRYIEEKVQPRTDFPEEELKKFYNDHIESFKTREAVRVYHILIKEEGEKGKQKAETVHQEIKTPQDFHRHASSCSGCPSGCNCGDLGFIRRGKMIPELDEVIFSLEKNEISKPVKTKFGYHILLVTDKKEAEITEFECIKDSLCERLREIEFELLLADHLTKLRENAEIKIFK